MTRTDNMSGVSSVSALDKHKKMTIGKNKLKLSLEGGVSELYFPELGTTANIDVMYYRGHRGNNTEFEFRASGAYIFRPDGDQAVDLGDPVHVLVTEGPVLDQVVRTYTDQWITQIINLYHEDNLMEVGWVVGPIPVEDGVGKEVILRYQNRQDIRTIMLCQELSF